VVPVATERPMSYAVDAPKSTYYLASHGSAGNRGAPPARRDPHPSGVRARSVIGRARIVFDPQRPARTPAANYEALREALATPLGTDAQNPAAAGNKLPLVNSKRLAHRRRRAHFKASSP
jgi:hypothetical protein